MLQVSYQIHGLGSFSGGWATFSGLSSLRGCAHFLHEHIQLLLKIEASSVLEHRGCGGCGRLRFRHINSLFALLLGTSKLGLHPLKSLARFTSFLLRLLQRRILIQRGRRPHPETPPRRRRALIIHLKPRRVTSPEPREAPSAASRGGLRRVQHHSLSWADLSHLHQDPGLQLKHHLSVHPWVLPRTTPLGIHEVRVPDPGLERAVPQLEVHHELPLQLCQPVLQRPAHPGQKLPGHLHRHDQVVRQGVPPGGLATVLVEIENIPRVIAVGGKSWGECSHEAHLRDPHQRLVPRGLEAQLSREAVEMPRCIHMVSGVNLGDELLARVVLRGSPGRDGGVLLGGTAPHGRGA
mmetsp:Transcript_39427/g.103201  ORF Transcript_39427/g.103201 Transcript_39427/m.103201 type:complete len:351 (-) Transcript_39427:32-1084(-)